MVCVSCLILLKLDGAVIGVQQVAADLNNETRDSMSVEAGLASMDPHGHCSKDDITAARHTAINNGVSNMDAAAAVAADGVKNNVSAAKVREKIEGQGLRTLSASDIVGVRVLGR
jgi:hypothetical protein